MKFSLDSDWFSMSRLFDSSLSTFLLRLSWKSPVRLSFMLWVSVGFVMYSKEVIERLKAKIPKLKDVCDDYKIYGITQLEVKCCDGTTWQIGD